ncbi:hypothetical protein [Mongoliitalea lutea]|nr:hypothetical protein [Mongoliitalea lutea]
MNKPNEKKGSETSSKIEHMEVKIEDSLETNSKPNIFRRISRSVSKPKK